MLFVSRNAIDKPSPKAKKRRRRRSRELEQADQREDQLREFLVKQGWRLSPAGDRVPSPTHLIGGSDLLQLASRSTTWGRKVFVEFTRSWSFDDIFGVTQERCETFRGILALFHLTKGPDSDTQFGRDDYVHVQAEPFGTDADDDLDYWSLEFDDKYRVDCSSVPLAYKVLPRTALTTLVDTYDYPDDLIDSGNMLDADVASRHPRFEYHIELGAVLVFRYHQPDNPIWSPTDDFVFLEAQFQRFLALLPLEVLRKG
jgi:hypothetical protein